MPRLNRGQIYASRYLAGKVKRYHTWPMIHPQSVAEHCWRVANLYVDIFGMPRAEVLYYCLNHDSGELSAGDPPFGVKRNVHGYQEAHRRAEQMGLLNLGIRLPELTELELVKVKICDLCEMHETGLHEMRLGNSYAEPIVEDTIAMANKLVAEYNLQEEFYHGSKQNPNRRHSLQD